jgi:hypothetical protein
LLGYHDNCLDRELPVAVVEQVLQARAEEVNDKDVVQALLAKVVNIRDAGWAMLAGAGETAWWCGSSEQRVGGDGDGEGECAHAKAACTVPASQARAVGSERGREKRKGLTAADEDLVGAVLITQLRSVALAGLELDGDLLLVEQVGAFEDDAETAFANLLADAVVDADDVGGVAARHVVRSRGGVGEGESWRSSRVAVDGGR